MTSTERLTARDHERVIILNGGSVSHDAHCD